MQDTVYMCKIASNKLVISRGLLELLGEDIETYALRLCKYKTPLKEYSFDHLELFRLNNTLQLS